MVAAVEDGEIHLISLVSRTILHRSAQPFVSINPGRGSGSGDCRSGSTVVVVYHVTIVAMDMGCWRNFGLFGNMLRSTHCREFLYVIFRVFRVFPQRSSDPRSASGGAESRRDPHQASLPHPVLWYQTDLAMATQVKTVSLFKLHPVGGNIILCQNGGDH